MPRWRLGALCLGARHRPAADYHRHFRRPYSAQSRCVDERHQYAFGFVLLAVAVYLATPFLPYLLVVALYTRC